MYDDESTVKSEGSDGIKSVENKITEINGQIVNTVALAEKVIKAPVDKVIVKGTKPRIPPVLESAVAITLLDILLEEKGDFIYEYIYK